MNETLRSTPSELTPSFRVTVTLDGDDDAALQTENVHDWLEQSLAEMRVEGLIHSFTLEEAS